MVTEEQKYSLLEKARKTDDNKCIYCKQIIYASDKSYTFEVVQTKKRRIHVFHKDCYDQANKIYERK